MEGKIYNIRDIKKLILSNFKSNIKQGYTKIQSLNISLSALPSNIMFYGDNVKKKDLLKEIRENQIKHDEVRDNGD